MSESTKSADVASNAEPYAALRGLMDEFKALWKAVHHGTAQEFYSMQPSWVAAEKALKESSAHGTAGHICGGEERTWPQEVCRLCGDGTPHSATPRRLTPDEIDLICDHYIAETAPFQCPPDTHGFIREALQAILRQYKVETAE